MTKRIGCTAVWLSLLLSPSFALAQDAREIEPYFMIVVDTSMSMEQLPSCTCDPNSCVNCLPHCDVPNVNGQPPANKKNRWAVALEALTGTFNNFECEAITRNDANVGSTAYDNDSSAWPYNQPWDCASTPAGRPCAFNSSASRLNQTQNGVLDIYAARVAFGLMTFDGRVTYNGANDLVPTANASNPLAFDLNRSAGIQGMWSYGKPQEFWYPGCPEHYMVDTGARSASATEGGMVTLNSCPTVTSSSPCPATCSACPGTIASRNTDIQSALLRARPYGSTPIAGALTDLEYHLTNDLVDPFKNCRKRYALLLTDGEPDPDYHQYGCDDPGYRCPYDYAKVIADRLVHGDSSHGPLLEQLFVVGMAVENSTARDALNEIALAGCKRVGGCDEDGDGNVALFANNFTSLMKNLTKAIDYTLPPASHSVPTYAAGAGTMQYQIATGFAGNTKPGSPWAGKIERTRFICDGATLKEQALDKEQGDLFHEALATQSTRSLITALPSNYSAARGSMTSNESGSTCGTGTCSMTTLAGVNSPTVFGASVDATKKDAIIDWLLARAGTRTMPLGDIQHSSPVVLGPPRFDTSDEAYNLFRARDDIKKRPLTVFVNSNEGLLHAFSVEKHAGTTAHPADLAGGEELWGFVPPILLDHLQDNLVGHAQLLDATPVVRDVYFNRSLTATASSDEYRTVLVSGTRSNATSAYFALDVTDPTDPKFLWQFTDADMGVTIGQAAIGQATFKISGTVKNGAIAVLPGGVGNSGSDLADGCSSGTRRSKHLGTSANAGKYFSYPVDKTVISSNGSNMHYIRDDVRCWTNTGRFLYFVDIQTGKLIKKMRNDANDTAAPTMFPSPMVGTPALYSSDIGAVATRAFVLDADGVLWRVDLSSSDPANWTANPFHDLFWEGTPNDGELSFEAPMLSVDEQGQLIVIVGTGDTNNMLKPTVTNRVVSLTEFIPSDATAQTIAAYRARLNWELGVNTPTDKYGLVGGELVTGSMALFEGQLFFPTFATVTDPTDSCAYGKGRIHAVDYRLYDELVTNVYYDSRGNRRSGLPATYAPKRLQQASIVANGQDVVNVTAANGVNNLTIMGMSVTQRPVCASSDYATDKADVYGDSYKLIKELTPPALFLVAQASGDDKLVTKRDGSELGAIELKMTRKRVFSRVTSWATSVD